MHRLDVMPRPGAAFRTLALPLLACALLLPAPGFAAGQPAAAAWESRHAFAVGTREGALAYETSPQDHSLPVSDLGFAPDGRAFVADAGSGRLIVADPGGTVAVELPFPPNVPPRQGASTDVRPAPRFFTLSFSRPTGEAYLLDLVSGEVHVYSPDWKRLRGFPVAPFARAPKSLAVLANGELLLHDPGKGKVFRLSAEGAPLGATREGRPTLVVVPGPGSGGEAGRDLVAFGEFTPEGIDLLAVDGYGAEPPRKIGTVARTREGSDLHVLPHPGDPLRFAVIEAGPRPGDAPRATLCRFVTDGSGAAVRIDASPAAELPVPPQRDLVPFHPYRLNGAGELVTFGQPDAGATLAILALPLPWPEAE